MDLIQNLAELRHSIDAFDGLRTSAVAADRQGWAGLVQRGTTFLAYPANDTLAFAPSRFIGYRDNNLRAHSENPDKDGRVTNPAISRILGSDPAPDSELEKADLRFCIQERIEPRSAGSFGVQRKYWALPEARRYLTGNHSMPSAAKRRGSQFAVGSFYSRDEVADALQLSDEKRRGNWLTGYSRQQDEFVIFTNVGTAGRTGHDYGNRWDGKRLVWFAKGTATLAQPLMAELISGDLPVHVFWRGQDRGPFTYAGLASADEVADGKPPQIIWSFDEGGATRDPQEAGLPGPIWHRGPPPSPGTRTAEFTEGPTKLYLMVLDGPASAAFSSLQEGQRVIKIGMSNDPDRRRRDLSCGFPPGCSLRWRVVSTKEFPAGQVAFDAEGKLLEDLRLSGCWIGGEFAIVDEARFDMLSRLKP